MSLSTQRCSDHASNAQVVLLRRMCEELTEQRELARCLITDYLDEAPEAKRSVTFQNLFRVLMDEGKRR